ncbi:hypothetical protein THIOM_000821 [Candidatus Thiomargarita nelsonii]|uniref:Uncharacterized protein n=1 Tax=Candidatus Thiomargarita nelsonii TaxID=1003181 RepID=A0A176S5S4_9GAMM|nr:hypothetical protein THIOM_000821 [Candidatus Thiomargarita nelsonii]
MPVGAVSGALSFGVGGLENDVVKIIAHGVVQGGLSAAQGGKFEHGFLAGSFGKIGGKYGFWGSVIAGGTAAELGGGKFANGALSAAFVYRFNDAMHPEEENMTIGDLQKRGPIPPEMCPMPDCNEPGRDPLEGIQRGHFVEPIDIRSGQNIYLENDGKIGLLQAIFPAHTAHFSRNPIGGSPQTQIEFGKQSFQRLNTIKRIGGFAVVAPAKLYVTVPMKLLPSVAVSVED